MQGRAGGRWAARLVPCRRFCFLLFSIDRKEPSCLLLILLWRPALSGTEATLAFEVRRLGAENVQVTDGRVQFSGPAPLIAAANLNLRTAERGCCCCSKPGRPRPSTNCSTASMPSRGRNSSPVDAAFPVKGSSLSSQLSSVPACQSIVKKAVVKRLMDGHHTGSLPETGPEYKLRFALRKNTVEMMLDTSGDGLHKRGYRPPRHARAHQGNAGRRHRGPWPRAARHARAGPVLRFGHACH